MRKGIFDLITTTTILTQIVSFIEKRPLIYRQKLSMKNMTENKTF